MDSSQQVGGRLLSVPEDGSADVLHSPSNNNESASSGDDSPTALDTFHLTALPQEPVVTAAATEAMTITTEPQETVATLATTSDSGAGTSDDPIVLDGNETPSFQAKTTRRGTQSRLAAGCSTTATSNVSPGGLFQTFASLNTTAPTPARGSSSEGRGRRKSSNSRMCATTESLQQFVISSQKQSEPSTNSTNTDVDAATDVTTEMRYGKWAQDAKDLFEHGVKMFGSKGRAACGIASLVTTRTVQQIRAPRSMRPRQKRPPPDDVCSVASTATRKTENEDELSTAAPIHRSKMRSGKWTDEERDRLLQGIEKHGSDALAALPIALLLGTRTRKQVAFQLKKIRSGRWRPAPQRPATKSKRWTEEERELFRQAIQKFGATPEAQAYLASAIPSRTSKAIASRVGKVRFGELNPLQDAPQKLPAKSESTVMAEKHTILSQEDMDQSHGTRTRKRVSLDMSEEEKKESVGVDAESSEAVGNHVACKRSRTDAWNEDQEIRLDSVVNQFSQGGARVVAAQIDGRTEDEKIEKPNGYNAATKRTCNFSLAASTGTRTSKRVEASRSSKSNSASNSASDKTENHVERKTKNRLPRKEKKLTSTTNEPESKVSTPITAVQLPAPCGAKKPTPYPEDPHEYYIEEESYLYHNPPLPSDLCEGVLPDDLRPLPPPKEIPALPSSAKWKFDAEQRIVHVDFQGRPLDPVDLVSFQKFMERDDLTLVSQGLLDTVKMNHSTFCEREMLRELSIGDRFYHKFRRFDRQTTENGVVEHVEIDGFCSMRMKTYLEYLRRRAAFYKEHGKDFCCNSDRCQRKKFAKAVGSCGHGLGATLEDSRTRSIDDNATSCLGQEKNEDSSSGSPETEIDPSFTFEDSKRKIHVVHVGVTAFYMIDVDMPQLLPKFHQEFLRTFQCPGVLPGGEYCMMDEVPTSARPFMGPNLYLTPPASFTHFHQDGHGTVDSGHFCLQGYNEIVMLRRVPERHKKHALWLLTGTKQNQATYFNGLYEEPHGDGLGPKPAWPSRGQIEDCQKMGYYPSVFILRPGQMVHINKGRLHAFRKLSTSPLKDTDCHSGLRKQLMEEVCLEEGKEVVCTSIAWDWMYRGYSAGGVNREVSTIIEAAILNRKQKKRSLAIPQLALMSMAQSLPTYFESQNNIGLLEDGSYNSARLSDDRKKSLAAICRGILPCLKYVVGAEINTIKDAKKGDRSKLRGKGERVSIVSRPNVEENPMDFPVDPLGDTGFSCILCHLELPNTYYHCDGCEKLLSKDFNICPTCHEGKLFECTVRMHPTSKRRHSTVNHVGNFEFDRTSRCPCRNGPVCELCGWCLGCSCRCHTWFTLNFRFSGNVELQSLVDKVERVVYSSNSTSAVNKYLDDPRWVADRFEVAKENLGDSVL